jgi:sugar lactone lactonase YvrE
MKRIFTLLTILSIVTISCNNHKKTAASENHKAAETATIEKVKYPENINIKGIAQNPEGIEFNKNDQTFLLSSLNAGPIIKVNLDGTFKPFTSGEPYPVSTAGIHADYSRNRLLVAGFNGNELYDQDPATKGISNLRIYNLETGVMQKDINLSSLVPNAPAYFANDVVNDSEGNVYITDWYAGLVYKVDLEGKPSVFWKNETGISSGANGIDYHKDGYLLVSLVSVNQKGLYANYDLIKIPVKSPSESKVVKFTNDGFTGFDGMVLKSNGNVVGVTNNGTSPGGNTLIEISSSDGYKSAKLINSKSLPASTTLAVTPSNENYVINQDFMQPMKEDWTIKQIKF